MCRKTVLAVVDRLVAECSMTWPLPLPLSLRLSSRLVAASPRLGSTLLVFSPISPLRQRGPEWTIGWPTLGLRNQAEEEQMAVCLVIKIPGGTRRYLGAGHKPAH